MEGKSVGERSRGRRSLRPANLRLKGHLSREVGTRAKKERKMHNQEGVKKKDWSFGRFGTADKGRRQAEATERKKLKGSGAEEEENIP